MILFESLNKHFYIVSADLEDIKIRRLNKSRLAKSIFIIMFTVYVFIRSWVLMLSTSKEFQLSAGDMFYILGNEAKTFHFLIAVCAVLNTILRVSVMYGELVGKLDSITDFEPLIRNLENYSELQLSPSTLVKFKQQLKIYVIWILLAIAGVFGCICLILCLVHTIILLKPIAITDKICILTNSTMLGIYLYYVTGGCFTIAFSWALGAVYMKYRFQDISSHIELLAAKKRIPAKQLLEVFKDTKLLLVKLNRYNDFNGKWMGFVICYVFNFLAGSGVFIMAYIEYQTPFVKYAQSAFCFQILMAIFFFTGIGGRVYVAALETTQNLTKLLVRFGPNMNPRVQLKMNEIVESLTSENRPVGYYCLDLFPLEPRTFIDVSFCLIR